MLPVKQDVMTDSGLLGWTDGPLPKLELELAALELFADSHPRQLWAESDMKTERDQARRAVLRLYRRFKTMERWTLGTMQERLQEGFQRIVCGDRGPTPAENVTLHEYAADCLQGLLARFSGDKNAMVLPDSASHTWMIPHGQGISEQWQQSYVATKFAEVLTELTCPGVPFLKLDVQDRTWLRGQTDQLVEDAVDRFTSHPGDPEYKPEDEPEYDFEGRTEGEAQS